MAEWIECTLGDLVTFQRGHDLPKSQMQEGQYPVVGSNGIIGFHNEYTTDNPSITVGRSGNVGKPYIYYGKTWSHNTTLYVKDYKGNDPVFVFYFLKTMDLANYAGGSAVPTLNRNHIHTLPVLIPKNVEIQRKIGTFLKQFDDKIEENERINKNLEQQAQAIFKSWFVDFEPFNGEMPYDWTVSRLGDIASIKTNSFSPVKNPDAQLEHYSIPAYDEQKYPVFESAAGVKSNKYILSKNSVMISKLNPDTKRVWRPMCLTELAVSSTEFIIFEAFNPAYRDFVFSIIDSAAFSDWMCAHTTGSTNSRQRTAPSATLEFQVALPNEKAITDFCAIVTPMYDTIASNICENQKLAQLRDAILPKLMSGELDVPDINL